VIDFNYNKALVVDDSSTHARIIDIASGNAVSLPYTGHITWASLSPQGAVYSTASDSLYDFNNGSVYPFGLADAGLVKLAGQYCL